MVSTCWRQTMTLSMRPRNGRIGSSRRSPSSPLSDFCALINAHPLCHAGCESVRDQCGSGVVSISPGFTSAEICEFVVQYHLLPHGQKGSWRAAQGVSIRQLRRWEAAVFAGDLDRGLIPREGSGVTVPPAKRTALAMAQTAKQERDEAELARLQARVCE